MGRGLTPRGRLILPLADADATTRPDTLTGRWLLYPTPTHGLMTLAAPDGAQLTRAHALDALGRRHALPLNQEAPGRWQLDARHLAPGLYTLLTTGSQPAAPLHFLRGY